MRTRKSLLTVLVVGASLATPAAALAQSAGDEQYTDPFGSDQPSEQPAEQPAGDGSGSDTGSSPPAAGGDGAAEPAPSSQELEATEAAPAQSALPRTGFPVPLIAAAGYVLLLAGTVIRRLA